MIESLETSRLFSQIPLLVYPCPSAVATDAQSIINAAPAAVVASAGQSVASGQAPSQAMLDVIEYHESYSLSIYPDSSGVPTVAVGLKLDSNDASFATAALSAAGVSYSDLAEDWSSIKSLWVSDRYPLADLKDTSPLWALFVEQNPSVATPVLTASQAAAAFNSAVSTKMAAAAAFFGPQFYLLDRDPQIALVDLAFYVADIKKYTALASQIQGNDQHATNYTLAAKQITPLALGSLQRARDDQQLMDHGEDASSIIISPSSATFPLGESATLVANPSGAFGKGIILPASDLKWTESVAEIVTMKVTKAGIELSSVHVGATNLSVTAGTASTTATAPITVKPRPMVTWQESGYELEVNGTFSTVGTTKLVYSPLPPQYEILVTAVAGGTQQSQGPLKFSLSITPGELEPFAVGAYAGGLVGITIGNDDFAACSVDITSYDPSTHFVAGTFSGGLTGDFPPPPENEGSVSGSFSGTFSAESAGKTPVAPPSVVTWQASGTEPDVDGAFSEAGSIFLIQPPEKFIESGGPFYEELFVTAPAVTNGQTSQQASLSFIVYSPSTMGNITEGVYSVLIVAGSDQSYSGLVDITTMVFSPGGADVSYIAGTFSAGPNDPSGQPGSISGSFSGSVSTRND